MPLIELSDYRPRRFFRNNHLNTLFPALFRKPKPLDYQRERVELPDDDFLDLDWSKVGSRQLLICLHGLEGNARRPYMAGMMHFFNAQGWDAVGINFRGCSGEDNRQLHGYHSGWTNDLDFLVNSVVDSGAYDAVAIVGFSVGGNIALKYAGEKAAQLPNIVKKIVTFSVPVDLTACSLEFEKTKNAFYQWQFLVTLKRKARVKIAKFPNAFDLEKVLAAKYFRQFDEFYTAPINGFVGAEDYWIRASSKPFLPKIVVPTLLVNALDDSFLAETCFPYALARESALFHLETPTYGGHLGFMTDDTEGYLWTERRAFEFVNS